MTVTILISFCAGFIVGIVLLMALAAVTMASRVEDEANTRRPR